MFLKFINKKMERSLKASFLEESLFISERQQIQKVHCVTSLTPPGKLRLQSPADFMASGSKNKLKSLFQVRINTACWKLKYFLCGLCITCSLCFS